MKVVFLDIDGVLSTAKSILEHDDNLALGISRSCDEDVIKVLDDNAVNNLMTLLEKTGAKIVLSSNWRTMKSVERLQELFGSRGFGEFIVDKTSDSWGASRGEEIQAWLAGQDAIASFVILDDIDDGITELFPDHFLECTDIEKGFGDMELLHKAIKLLGEEP